MATVLLHIQPWMQKSVYDVEDARRLSKKNLRVHQHLDVFELRVLARPTFTIQLTTLQDEVAN